jgi:hypothetical protein
MATGTPVVVMSPNGATERVVVVATRVVDVVVVVVVSTAAVVPGAVVLAPVTEPPHETMIVRSKAVDPRTVAGYCRSGYCGAMFGPLNGVRVALVSAAAVAALAAFFVGFTGAGVVLLIGVGVHGLGWLYLYAKQDSGH